ncbi:GDP-mannose pyrophosphatase NudK [Pedobacter panaciterrae]|uniref:GDP-mannose pyrophosphatase n=1 Tax=Pedobacter panaciterrae TaxID=363849 RepID=A0ABU8NRP0_9SPHI
MEKNIKLINKEILSDNWYILNKVTYQAEKKDGKAVVHTREVYDRGNGATILLYNRERNTVILTKQFRLPTYLNGNKDGMLIETCAGLLDLDSPEDCIKRETEEETGFKIIEVTKIFEAYMSPGSVTELLYFFIASYTSEMKINDGGGLPEEEEHITVLEIPFPQAFAMIELGEIKDGKTIMLLQHLLINRIMTLNLLQN